MAVAECRTLEFINAHPVKKGERVQPGWWLVVGGPDIKANQCKAQCDHE